MFYCRKCGSPLKDNQKFCTQCGTLLDQEKESVSTFSSEADYKPKRNLDSKNPGAFSGEKIHEKTYTKASDLQSKKTISKEGAMDSTTRKKRNSIGGTILFAAVSLIAVISLGFIGYFFFFANTVHMPVAKKSMKHSFDSLLQLPNAHRSYAILKTDTIFVKSNSANALSRVINKINERGSLSVDSQLISSASDSVDESDTTDTSDTSDVADEVDTVISPVPMAVLRNVFLGTKEGEYTMSDSSKMGLERELSFQRGDTVFVYVAVTYTEFNRSDINLFGLEFSKIPDNSWKLISKNKLKKLPDDQN
jgi:zinc-ribbon domain